MFTTKITTLIGPEGMIMLPSTTRLYYLRNFTESYNVMLLITMTGTGVEIL